MRPLPTGTITLLFTDMEDSTPMLQRLGDEAYASVLADHARILREACTSYGGFEVETHGDGTLVAFRSAVDAARAAAVAQRAIGAHPWPSDASVRVRIGLHTGAPIATATGYVGIDVHRAARVCQAAWGGQTLLTEETKNALAVVHDGGLGLRDLGPHRLKGLQRAEQVFQLVHPGIPDRFPPVRSLDSLPNNLPRQLTGFVGREQEMARVQTLLSAERLVTLTGSGGCGKTRLALQVAADRVDAYRDGAWLVEMAPVADPSLVTQEVASALGVREQQGRPLPATLIEFLQPRTLLLVLDNCEHLVGACAELAERLLRACPNLTVLATSRVPLRVPGETIFRVPSLAFPERDRMPPAEQMAEFDSVRLFVERARAAQPAFALTRDNAVLIGHICQRLDGIPLAIELAAARAKVLPLQAIATRLHDRFRFLSGGSRTAMQRQQTLRAAMDWSHELLDDRERGFFARLSVFAGGWTLDAAEAVCAGDGIDPDGVLDLVTQLVDHSLVTVDDEPAGTRYRMLETIRQYSRDRLLELREDERFRRRHRDWYLQVADRAESEIRGPSQAEWLARLEADHDNMRAALDWCLNDPSEIETGMRLAIAMARFWWIRGHLSEARRWIEGLLQKGETASDPARARLLLQAGRLAWTQSDYPVAEAFLRRSLALFRALAEDAGIRDALNMLGLVALAGSEYADAGRHFREALTIARDVGDQHQIAIVLGNLGLAETAIGRYDAAEGLQQECLLHHRATGDAHGAAVALRNLGRIAMARGDVAAAESMFGQSLETQRRLGNRQHIMALLADLGAAAAHRGDLSDARRLCGESLELARELDDREGAANALVTLARADAGGGALAEAAAHCKDGLALRLSLRDRRGVAECLEIASLLYHARGRGPQALHLWSAAASARRAINAPLPPIDALAYAAVAGSAPSASTAPSLDEAVALVQAL